MKQFSDKVLARRILETRDQGYSISLVFRRNLKSYLWLASCFAFILLAFVWLQVWSAFYLVLGIFAGAAIREVRWVRFIGQTWPFSLKVTDWEKVQRLADGDEVG